IRLPTCQELKKLGYRISICDRINSWSGMSDPSAIIKQYGTMSLGGSSFYNEPHGLLVWLGLS
ncbi:MAG: hypothetical protein AAFR14_13170, partial [Bacteroidota bacterium]